MRYILLLIALLVSAQCFAQEDTLLYLGWKTDTVRFYKMYTDENLLTIPLASIGSGGGGSGTVTSVALSLPAIFSVSGSPVTTSGTLMGSLATQTTNKVFAAPDGSTGAPTFRALTSNDIPSLTAFYEVPLTFGTGLTRTTNTVTVNTSQSITKLSNLTSNGFVVTSGGDGTLGVDANTYLTGNQSITLSGDISGVGTTAITTAIGNSKVTNSMLAGSIAYSKLSLTGAILNADLAGSVAYSKLSLTGAILNADLAGSIAYSKLSLTGAILNADLAGSIAASNLVGSDIATVGTVTSGTWNATKLSEVYGGTNQNAYTLGDVLYSSATNTLSKLSGNTTATKKYLSQTGNGTISAAPSWSAVTMATTTYDLSTAGTGYIVRDSDIADVLIAATSLPATAQWKFGIRAQDLPTAAIIQDYAFIATFGGKNNNGASARTINWRFSVNNVDKGSAASGSVPTATPFWKASVYGGLATSVVVGDTIGIKLFGSVTNDLDFRYITIYFVPRFFTPGTGFLQASSGFTALHQTTISGAVSGVSYAATSLTAVQPTFYDNTTSTLMGSFTTGVVYTIGSGYRLSSTNSIADNNNYFGLGVTAAASLNSLSGGTACFLRYIYSYTVN